MKTFVTGATGLLGSNLVRTLAADGHAVRALVRSRDKGRALLGDLPGVELVEGDLADVDGFAPALAGCEALFHTAAYFREYFGGGDHRAQLQAINVDGSLALMQAARRHGIQRAVDTSAGGIIGTRPNG